MEVNEKDEAKVMQCSTETILFTLMHGNFFLGQVSKWQSNKQSAIWNVFNWLDFQILHIFPPQESMH